jgi:hypothetical protein
MTMTDDQALARYRYLLQTAPPDDLERAHEEAFAQLTPDQRRQALAALAAVVPPSEIRGDDPAALARTATRAELRQPGTIERAWGPTGGAPGLGSFFLTTLAASFVGTAIAQAFFDPSGDAGVEGAADAPAEGAAELGDPGDVGGDVGGDFGDIGGIDFGDFGGF